MTNEKLVDISDLRVWFDTDQGEMTAVDHISFHVNQGEILGIVGESGCGKSITSLALMGLLPKNAYASAEKINFEGENLIEKDAKYMRGLRGDRLSMIFQEPMTSLNPVLTIGKQLTEVLMVHRGMTREKALAQSMVIDMLERVGIAAPQRCMRSYPYEMSGGMRQRIMIAMALLCGPKMLIADEPTTSLDVTIQAQILELLKRLRDENGMSIMLITHDLGVIAETCERVIVMYAGEIVEQAEITELFANPKHPYTEGLLHAIPRLERTERRLKVIRGTVPGLNEMPSGCKFHPRCDSAMDICRKKRPPLAEIKNGHCVACWKHVVCEKGEEV